MPISVERFIQALTSIGIVTAADAESLAQSVPPEQHSGDADEFARDLVRHGRLTRFQAAAIYQDKADGLLLGNYLILDKLGAGGMGQVYRARHRRMDRVVALKVLSKKLLDSTDAVARFQREARAAARLTHPNIVTAHDADEAGGMHFLVMEYVEGSDLASLVRRHGPLPVQQALDLLLQAARGLEHAHGKGIIHRDIKPSNLLLDKEGTLKILDMGLVLMSDPLATAGAKPGADLTHSGSILGTIDYMAPEQAMDCHQADARSDIYSLGCTMHYLLTGWPPYDGDSVAKRLTAHQQAAIPLVSSARSDVSPGFDEILSRMMAKQPDARFQTSKDLIAALDALRHQPAVVRPVPIAVRPVVVQPVMAGAAAPGSSGVRSLESIVLPRDELRPRGRKPSSKMPLLAAAAVLLLATAGTGAWMISGDKPDQVAQQAKEPANVVQPPSIAVQPKAAEPQRKVEPANEAPLLEAPPAAALPPDTIPAKNEPAASATTEAAPLVVAAVPPDVAAIKLAQATPPAAAPASFSLAATHPASDARLPVPGIEAQRESQKLLAEVYKEGYARAKQPDAKAALAEKLLNESQRAQDDVTGLYVMLLEARNLAVDAANPALAERAINMLADRYAVEPLKELAAALDEMTGKPHPAEANRAIVEAALARVEQAQANDDFETAKRISDVAMAAGRKAKDASLSKRAIEVGKSVAAAKQQWEAWQKAQATLAQNPDDSSANLAVGRYLSFVQGNWDQGLVHLAKGPDGPLADLAAKSLPPPTDAVELAELGDVWFSAAEKSKGKEKVDFRAGARYWYSQAVPELTGLMKAKIEKRLAELGGKLATPREVVMRSLQVLFKDEFDDPKSGWGEGLTIPAGKPRWFGYEKGRFFITRLEPGTAWVGRGLSVSNFLCSITGRVTGAVGASWGLALQCPDRRFFIRVSVTNDQRVTIRPIVQPPMDQGVTAGPFVQPQLNKGTSFNTLIVMLRNSKLEIYANGQRVCDPLTLPDINSLQIRAVVSSDAANSFSEFERIAIYALPPGEARAAEIARELSRANAPVVAESPASSTQSQIDREVAEWVLSLHGAIATQPPAERFGAISYITATANLPVGPFPAVAISFANNMNVTDQDMERIEKLSNLVYLRVDNTGLGDETLIHAARVGSLRSLTLTGTTITDAGLASLEKMPQLTYLYVRQTNISDAGADHFCRLPNLEYLGLSNTYITEVTISKLRHLKALRTLLCGGINHSKAAYNALANLQQITELGLSATSVTDDDLVSLARLPNLKTLHIRETAVTDRGLDILSACTSLTLLNVGLSRVTAAGAERFKGRLPNCQLFY